MRRTMILMAVLATAGAGSGTAQSDVAFAPEVYAQRRARLMEELQGAVIVPGADLTHRGEFDKQDPNFWYLTGVDSPYSIMVMIPLEGGVRSVLFLPTRFQFAGAQYPMEEPRFRQASWNRPILRLSPGPAAEESTGVDATYPIDDFARRLPELLAGQENIYLARVGGIPYTPPGLIPAITVREQLERGIGRLLPLTNIEDATPAIERMRLIKDEHEIAALRQAARISADGLIAAMHGIRPGLNDLEIAGLMEYTWKREGSPRPSFGPIVSSGRAAVSLYTLKAENYHPTDHVMGDGELIFIDYGAAEYRTYTSDVCRTFPVSGRFSDRQRFLYAVVLEAQDSALALIRPGAMMIDVVRAAARVYQRHGFADNEDIERLGPDHVWGVMPSPTHYLTRGRGLTVYSGARGIGVRDLGHHIGIEAIDSRDYSGPLRPGMVITVEPKLYVPDEDTAIMIEDMILVTDTGYENLSASAPRRPDEIERVMAESPSGR